MLINCKECNKEYSDKAEACPNCGCPTVEMQEQAEEKQFSDNKWYVRYFIYLIFGGVLFVLIGFIVVMATEQSSWGTSKYSRECKINCVNLKK